jgi:hypothetical protein
MPLGEPSFPQTGGKINASFATNPLMIVVDLLHALSAWRAKLK